MAGNQNEIRERFAGRVSLGGQGMAGNQNGQPAIP